MVRRSLPVALALTFDYGQRAARPEIAAAQKFCARWDIPHRIISIPWLGEVSSSALTNQGCAMPHLSTADLDSLPAITASAEKVWVPNRNGVFLNIAAAIAEAQKISWLVVGFNREEATTFPDNSTEYVEALNRALYFSTMGHVGVISPTQAMVKRDIVAWGRAHDVLLNDVWPCYEGHDAWCRRCESCLRFLRAMES
jgi:7-cyano-7-deazaguanine synthase